MPRFHEIISYPAMINREGVSLQKGMNFRVRAGAAGYSIILMSVRKGAPYQDQWHDDSEQGPHAGMLEYEGHDVPRYRGSSTDPKKIDQPMSLPSGRLTENGKFYQAAMDAKGGIRQPEIVQVYEKISNGIWCDRGRYLLLDAQVKAVPIGVRTNRTRNVFRFFLSPTITPQAQTAEDERELMVSRQIPTLVKVAVWKRDQGQCVMCGSRDNLHFDHDVPFSKGGSSITPANVKLLCARHNLEKSNRIIALGPVLAPLFCSTLASMMRGA